MLKKKKKAKPQTQSVERVVTREEIAERNEGALFCDGFDDCLLGVMVRFGSPPVALYDHTRMIQKMVKRDGDGGVQASSPRGF